MPRPHQIVLAIVAGLGAIAVGGYVALTREPVERITIDDPARYWIDEGFVEMVPPIRLPSSSAGADDVAIWLKIPEGGVIETRQSEARGGLVLVFPPGTIADRVEQRGRGDARGVVDVRGARLDADGREWLHTLRRSEAGANAPMFGYEWLRSDPEAHASATEQLLTELAVIRPGADMNAPARERYLDGIRRKNDCAGCHTYERPDNTVEGEHGVVNRGTDGSGWFTPQTVLLDSVVVERYGDVDPNLDDPAISIACPGGGEPGRVTRGARERAVCPDGRVPIATFDPKKLDPARLDKLCDSRRYLHEHLDARGKQAFEAALDPCEGVD